MIQEKRVWELFSELVSIDNPSLREEKMCKRIKIFLKIYKFLTKRTIPVLP